MEDKALIEKWARIRLYREYDITEKKHILYMEMAYGLGFTSDPIYATNLKEDFKKLKERLIDHISNFDPSTVCLEHQRMWSRKGRG